MVSMVDGADDEDGHYRFNRELSRTGYTVQVISADGYKAELSSQDVAYNDGIFLAYLKMMSRWIKIRSTAAGRS